MSLVIAWAISAFCIWATAALLPGFKLATWKDAFVVAAVLGILNTCVGWLLRLLIIVGTLGVGYLLMFLTRWVVQALLLQATAKLTPRLQLRSFGWSFLGAMFMSALTTFAEYVVFGGRGVGL